MRNPCKHTSNQHKYTKCAEITICQCPSVRKFTVKNKSDKKCREIDLDYTASKLQELINDSSACNDCSRISSLLYDFLHETGDKGFVSFKVNQNIIIVAIQEFIFPEHRIQYIKHLPAVMDILEFLSWKAKDVKQYQIHLDRMLELCCEPLVLEKNSEILSSLEFVEQYLSVLGYILVILPTKAEVLQVCRALGHMLIHSKYVEGPTVPLEIYHQAMERSQLPIVLAKLLEVSSHDIYQRILDLLFIVVSLSSLCCESNLKNEQTN